MILYPDQEIVLEEARQKLRLIKPGGRRPCILIQAPCGFGKTAVAAFIAKSVQERGLSSWFICHRDFLLSQTSITFDSVGIPHSYMAAGRKMDASIATQIGMIGSIKSRASKLQAPTIAVWDECHHMGAKTWAERMEAMPDTIHIGLSATPMRTDKQGLGKFFDEIVLGPSVNELIAKRRLSDYVYYAPSKPDLSGVHIKMGEYVTSELDQEMTKAKIVGDIVGSYEKYAKGTKAVYFATSVETSRRYADAFNRAGVRALHLDADSSSTERHTAAIEMAMGRLNVICNVGLFGEGYDIASQAGIPTTIETVGLCRPTKSLPLLIQQMMRCMRAKDYPGIILDHAGCFEEHNFLPDDEIQWSLEGSKRNVHLSTTFQCEGCGAALRRGNVMCVYCGADNSRKAAEIAARKGPIEVAGELYLIDQKHRDKELIEKAKHEEALRRNRAIHACKSYADFVALGKRMNYAPGWAIKQAQIRRMR